MSKTFTSRPSVANRGRGSNRGTGNQTNSRGALRAAAGLPSSVRGGQVPSNRSRQAQGRGSQAAMDNMDGYYGARLRGRGTGMLPPTRQTRQTRGAPVVQEEGPEEVGAVGGNAPSQAQAQSQEQRMTYQGGYSMVAPNQRKRQQISEQAQRETEEYEKYKAANKKDYVSYHGTVGGGQMTEAEARRKLAQSNANSKHNMLEKKKMHREEQRRHEERGYEKKKMEARRKTEENARRAVRDQDRQREEMERIKNNFLDRLEKEKSKPKASSSQPQPGPSKPAQSTPSRSHDRETTNERRQMARPMRSEDSDMTSEMNSDLQTLVSMFPQYSPEAIAEVYNGNHSLELTAEILSDT